MEHRVLY